LSVHIGNHLRFGCSRINHNWLTCLTNFQDGHLSLLAVLAGAETFTDIARFGEKKLPLLRRFRPFRDGTSPHDRVGDIFATLDADQFQR
jgi:hypothetical protein